MTDAELEALVALGEGITPGPWVVNPFVAQVDCEAISAKGGLLPVCQMLWPTDERGEDETEANARAIAAVPQLIAALQSIGPLMRERDAIEQRLAEAIQKARDECGGDPVSFAYAEAAMRSALKRIEGQG